MSDSQPTRPPRITRGSSKDVGGGLLMSVIRSLTASRDSADRDREKANLDKEFRESDARLSSLVVSHHSDLSSVMSAFSKISHRLKQSKERLVNSREKLQTCMNLLHCKRDELKKLWLESVENKIVLQLLGHVEQLMDVPQEVSNFINKKHYLHATKLLMNSLNQLEGGLSNVDALREVRTELLMKKDNLYEIIIDEFHKHLYVRSTAEILKRFRRQGSDKKMAHEGTPVRKLSATDLLSPSLGLLSKKKTTSYTRLDLLSDEDIEDLNIADPEEDFRHFITILIKCLALLNKIPEAVETIKERCEKELANIVKRTGRELTNTDIDNHANSGTWSSQNKLALPTVLRSSLILVDAEHGQTRPSLLFQDFLELLFQQFRCVIQLHENLVLVNLRKFESSNKISEGDILASYGIEDIWSKIQLVLQLVADLYLDISGTGGDKNTTNVQEPTGLVANPTVADLSSYFAKRRGLTAAVSGLKPKKIPLFRFDSSSHAMSMNAYLQEQKEAMREKSDFNNAAIDSLDLSLNQAEQYLVVSPAIENIVLMFNFITKFIGEIDDGLQLEYGNHCPLHSYIMSCTKLFSKQVNGELERMLEHANKSLDIWKVTSDPETLSALGLERPLLQSTLMIDRAIHDLRNIIFALPLYGDEFLTYICNVLLNYKETCLAAYRGIVQPEPEDKRIISATWAKDEDISRFLKSLPNWITLQNVQLAKHSKVPMKLLPQESRMTFDESPEEIRLRNMRECEILTSNLTQDTLIPNHEILSDVAQLRILAQLQESMEWLGKRCETLATSLQTAVSQESNPNSLSPTFLSGSKTSDLFLSDSSFATLHQLSREFNDLAETCLLVLHLEVRVHCFYYLLPLSQSSFALAVDSQEPDIEVVRYNKDLTAIDEAMGIALQPWKLRYIFEGVGHLVATILINAANTIKRINNNGVKKMCRNIFAIQQTLTSVTMTREVALDYARQYFELFYHSSDEILSVIVERGPQFQLSEYTSAINLLHRSLPGRDMANLEATLGRLAEILNEVAVSV